MRDRVAATRTVAFPRANSDHQHSRSAEEVAKAGACPMLGAPDFAAGRAQSQRFESRSEAGEQAEASGRSRMQLSSSRLAALAALAEAGHDSSSSLSDVPVGSRQSSSSTLSSPADRVAPVRRLLFNRQLITVNFLVDDLRFYLEMDK